MKLLDTTGRKIRKKEDEKAFPLKIKQLM